MKRTIQGLLLTGSLVFGGAALAQSNMQGEMMKDPNAKAGKTMAKGGTVEHMGFVVPADEKAFLERLHHINQMEIQIGKLAQQNGQSQEVKSYGETLVKDHTTADQQVMAYAQKKGLTLANTPKPMNDVERKAMAAEKAAMDKLQSLKGMPFDSCFLAHMVGDHDAALGKLMAAQQAFTTADITPVLKQHVQSVTSHRQQAYSLLGKIGPASNMGVGGSGDMPHDMKHKDSMNTGMGGSGDFDKGQQGDIQEGQLGSGDSTKKKY
ncbi:DUF4142 domain-containing protein [Hyalangium rubrum]|uniref:DUF4142 domain-containing protein n=1 Tax=Hyalangium rubrum TaxID=3103134 RepID=A0ABU5GY23_9BACT|nr:DUF4142 domain-containing protein [Hyalangium sp. s54d21]MDY7226101.1 DUF4142 domain-containing protein [Hyalangium sp. s54d21]